MRAVSRRVHWHAPTWPYDTVSGLAVLTQTRRPSTFHMPPLTAPPKLHVRGLDIRRGTHGKCTEFWPLPVVTPLPAALQVLPGAGADLRRDGLLASDRRVERRLRHGGAAAGAAAVPRRLRRRPAGGDHQGVMCFATSPLVPSCPSGVVAVQAAGVLEAGMELANSAKTPSGRGSCRPALLLASCALWRTSGHHAPAAAPSGSPRSRIMAASVRKMTLPRRWLCKQND